MCKKFFLILVVIIAISLTNCSLGKGDFESEMIGNNPEVDGLSNGTCTNLVEKYLNDPSYREIQVYESLSRGFNLVEESFTNWQEVAVYKNQNYVSVTAQGAYEYLFQFGDTENNARNNPAWQTHKYGYASKYKCFSQIGMWTNSTWSIIKKRMLTHFRVFYDSDNNKLKIVRTQTGLPIGRQFNLSYPSGSVKIAWGDEVEFDCCGTGFYSIKHGIWNSDSMYRIFSWTEQRIHFYL